MRNYPGSLHNHTDFSNIRLRDCINKIPDLINYAIELGHEVVAITDHETLSSFIQVEEYAEKIKEKHPDFKVIRGNEIYLTRNNLNAQNFNKDKGDDYYHFVLLAKDIEGYHQLCELSTRAWLRSYVARRMRRVPTYYRDLKEIILPNQGHLIGSSACFTGEAEVLTREGKKRIDSITNEDWVMNYKGEWEKVNFPTSRPYQGRGFTFRFCGDTTPLTCTENHQFLVSTNNKLKSYQNNPSCNPLQWVEAKDLNLKTGGTKHFCLYPLPQVQYSQNDTLYRQEWENVFSVEGKIHKTINDEIPISPEVMRLFGLFLGDGHISFLPEKNYYCVGFTFNEKEFPIYWMSFIETASKQIGVRWSITHREEHHRVDLASHSVELVKLFYYLFQNAKANKKSIPHRLLHISYELDCELLFGYELADGYFRLHQSKKVASSGEMVSVSISKQLSYDIFYLLKTLKIKSSLTHKEGYIDKNQGGHQESWYISSSNNAWKEVKKTIPYTHEEVIELFQQARANCQSRFITIHGVYYEKVYIKSREEILLDTQVYCLNDNSHSFVCDNVIVHNCLGGRLPRYLLQYFETENPEYRDVAKRWCVYMRDLFGEGNFYLELQPSHNPQQIFVNKQLLEISNELGIPYIITTDSHYLKKTDADIHEKYLNSQDGDREVKSFYASTYMMSTEELESYFPYFSPAQFEIAYNNIRAIAAACQNYSIKRPLRIPHLPWLAYNHNVANIEFYLNKMPSLRKFLASKRSADHELVYAVIDGIQRHQDLQNDEAYEALEECLDMTWISSEVNNAEWSAYYLNLQKIIGECWNAGTIVGPARGSGGGFVLLYCLDIIQMNKLREHTKLFPWRFLNPARVSVLDVDVDISGLKRGQVLQHLRAVYGEDRVSNVSTFRTEKSKSAILTAARGLDLPPEEGQYLASLVNAERGQLFSLHTMYYGDENDNIPPSSTFIEEMNKHPDVWEVAQKIEGLICGLGIHAGGVVFNDEPFTNTASLMRAPDGTIVSGFELHDLEKCSLIKYDVLSVEGMDKIQICLELLQQYGYIDSSKSLREIYEDTIGIYNIDRTSEDMWKMVWEHKIISLFQMEQQSGIQAIAKTHPTSVDDLATINSVIRLMAQEKGGESPIDKYARFREHPEQWEEEMTQYGLTAEEKKILHKELDISCGLSIAQEQFMELVQMPEIGGFDLQWSDRLRKSIAKKNPKDYEQLTKEFYENMRQKHLSEHLCSYVWQVLIAMNRGYGFDIRPTMQ